MGRSTIADVARAAGVSVATVDRVINRRARVKADTAKRVLDAAEKLEFRAVRLIRHHVDAVHRECTLGFLLQKGGTAFYQMLAGSLSVQTRDVTSAHASPVVEFVEELTPTNVADALRSMGRRVDAVAVVAADHPKVSQAVQDLADDGIPVVAIVTDLSAPTRTAYVGLDLRKVGRTAAWAVSRLRHEPGKVCVMLGSHRYLNQELCEISFRSYLREHDRRLEVLETMVSLEEPGIANVATLELLARYPDLAGIYVAGGGVEGVIEALRESGARSRVITVCPELNDETRRALVDGIVDLVISHPLDLLAEKTVAVMLAQLEGRPSQGPAQIQLPCELYTPENV